MTKNSNPSSKNLGQYSYMSDLLRDRPTNLGLVSNATWHQDPKGLLFSLSRYKFVSKMLAGSTNVVEIGCGDGWYSKIVASTVEKICLTDFDEIFVENAKKNTANWNLPHSHIKHDWVNSPLEKNFDAAYCLDVLEHIDPAHQEHFFKNIIASCKDKSVVIFGIPSSESQETIPADRRDPGHINCQSQGQLIDNLKKFFSVVLPFSMNDEVLHTGYAPMSQYLFAVCVI